MKTVHKSVLIWYSAAEMFALVTDVASYPAFLPWCDRASVQATHVDGVTAKVLCKVTLYNNSFIVRARNGKMVVVTRSAMARRVNGKWQPKWSKGLYGPPPKRTFANKVIMDSMDRLARIRWPINWEHESERVINGGGV